MSALCIVDCLVSARNTLSSCGYQKCFQVLPEPPLGERSKLSQLEATVLELCIFSEDNHINVKSLNVKLISVNLNIF